MADKATYPVVIIGAGASGLAAAIAASRVRPHSVLLLEKEDRVGRKLLATGNGRCNLLNMDAGIAYYHGDGAYLAASLLAEMPPDFLRQWFAEIGLTCREEAEGRVYPFSGQAASVLDALRAACARLGVETRTQANVRSIEPDGGGFLLHMQEGTSIRAGRVIVAGGGKASPNMGSDGSAYGFLKALGHTLTATTPAIAPLKVSSEAVRGLKGVRTPATLTLMDETGRQVRTETGEVLFADDGVSGIAAMQLARHVHILLAAGVKPVLSVSLMPEKMAQEEMEKRLSLYKGDVMENLFIGLLHKRIGIALLRAAGLSPQVAIKGDLVTRVLPLLSDWRMPILGTMPLAQAQVTAGGIETGAFDPQTLESYLVPGLYACGEVLDVDGDCGGYNLMWAWASGIRAGASAAD